MDCLRAKEITSIISHIGIIHFLEEEAKAQRGEVPCPMSNIYNSK